MNTINTIKRWIAARPWLAIVLSWLFGSLSTAAAFREDWLPVLVNIFIFGIIVMITSINRYVIPLVVSASIIVTGLTDIKAQEPPAQDPKFEPAGATGVAVVVVVVGGVCVYLLVKTCQRLFPKTPPPSTNEPPNFGGISGRSDDTAGSWSYSAPVSCYEPMSDQQWPQVTMELSGTIEENEQGPFFNLSASRRMNRSEDSLDYNQFQQDLARHGINIGPIGTMNYGRNGSPAYEQETPIRFSQSGGDHLVSINSDSGPSIPMAVQRSFDMKSWTDFGYVAIPVGQRFTLIDTTTKQTAFYRIQPR